MNRQREFEALRAAGWTVYTDSPWRRAGDAMRSLFALLVRIANHPVRRPA
jgi:hypothetical protein